MELTGNTLKEFWIWYLLPEQRKTYKTRYSRGGGGNAVKIRFLSMSFTERYGVYEDFFDSVGVRISINQHDGTYWCDIQSPFFECNEMKSRVEARTAAIDKANELRNEVLNK
tara:strand:+ start:1659 stop:1994 length:336 start_codon:yes stop_codon:yes gene_type:complete